MKIRSLKIRPIVSIVLLIMVTFFCQPNPVGGAPILNTDKDIYNYGEMIKVNFSTSILIIPHYHIGADKVTKTLRSFL